jgi:hypothetical protein
MEGKIITTGKDLIAFIENNDLQDALVIVGCEGYTSGEDDEVDAYTVGDKILICDSTAYEEYGIW